MKKVHGNSKNGNTYRELYPKEYGCWAAFIQRCCNPNNKKYQFYGGRGITVSDEWRNNFLCFIKDMGKAPSQKHTLDRERNNEGYCKENCRWVSYYVQNINRSNTKMFTYQGKTQHLTKWAEEFNLNLKSLWYRIRRGMTIDQALTTPFEYTCNRKSIKSAITGTLYKSKTEAMRALQIGERRLRTLIKNGELELMGLND